MYEGILGQSWCAESCPSGCLQCSLKHCGLAQVYRKLPSESHGMESANHCWGAREIFQGLNGEHTKGQAPQAPHILSPQAFYKEKRNHTRTWRRSLVLCYTVHCSPTPFIEKNLTLSYLTKEKCL